MTVTSLGETPPEVPGGGGKSVTSATVTTPVSPSPRVALATCAALPDGDPDDQLLADACRAVGLACEIRAWTDRAVDWGAFDAVVLRSTWDYPDHHGAFLAWARSVGHLFNTYPVVERNTDKRYLAELADAGLPVVPTHFVQGGHMIGLPEIGEVVIKPSVGAGSRGAGRFDLADPDSRSAAEHHVATLNRAGRTALVQPYVRGVDLLGETAMVFIDGAFSHAVRKGAMLRHAMRHEIDGVELYVQERIEHAVPDTSERRVAFAVVDHLQRTLTPDLLYARIDLLPSPSGPLVVEVELTEPSLFLSHHDGAAARFANAIAGRIRRDA